jgi:thymidine kinase
MEEKKLGKLKVYFGPMFSGKTAVLVEDGTRLPRIAKRKVLVCMPTIDTRRSRTEIVSLSGARVSAIQVGDPFEILRLSAEQSTQEVLIDEVQFFRQRVKKENIEGWSIVFVVKALLQQGTNVRVAGLNTSFLGYPFPPTTDLMGMADDLVKMRAICTVCGEPADWSLRLIDGQPARTGELIVVAGTQGEEGVSCETYEARCSNHHPFL